MSQSEKQNDKQSSKRWLWLVLVLILVLVLFLLRNCASESAPVVVSSSSSAPSSSSVETQGSSVFSSSGEALSSLVQSSSAQVQKSNKAVVPSISSSSSVQVNADQTPPNDWDVEPLPGIYREAVQIKFKCLQEKKCKFKVDFAGKTQLLDDGQILTLSNSATLQVQAQDSVGNLSTPRGFEYKILKRSDRCPADMIPVGSGPDFCMDAFEWPNQKGAKPKASVTLQEALDLCKSVSKELCSSEQWSSACQAGKGWKYPYGDTYQQNYCNSGASAPDRSGYNPNCRSWEGVYDLSGNLWEWTSTPARNKSYNLVAGGSWDSRSGTSCSERKYSFFPQNQYPMVGFRCCKAAK